MQRTADSRRRSPSHRPATPSPMGVTAPMPVMTTLRCCMGSSSYGATDVWHVASTCLAMPASVRDAIP